MRRRELVRILGWAAAGAAASPAMQAPLSLAAAGEGQERLLRVLDAPERLDASVLDTMRQVLWLCFDLGSYRDAEYYYEDARAKAHAAADTPQSAMVLCTLSHLATWTGRPRLGVDHAVAAQGWAQQVSDPLLRGCAFDVAARAHASGHQRDACLASLEAAESEVAAAGSDLDPSSLAYFYGRGQLESARGTCQLDLGETESAAAAATAALAGIDPSFVRNRAMCTVTLGEAYARMGEIDEAVDATRQASALVVQNRSVRAVRDFRVLCGELAPWRQTPAVRDLLGSVADLGLIPRPA